MGVIPPAAAAYSVSMGVTLSPIAAAIWLIFRALTFIIIIDILLGYFLDYYHPIRQFLDSIVEPMLNPIRRMMPQTGGLDFSPLVLIVLLELVGRVIVGILS